MIDIAFYVASLFLSYTAGYIGGLMILCVKKLLETSGQ